MISVSHGNTSASDEDDSTLAGQVRVRRTAADRPSRAGRIQTQAHMARACERARDDEGRCRGGSTPPVDLVAVPFSPAERPASMAARCVAAR